MPEISGGWRVRIARPGLTAFLWSTPYSGVGRMEEVTMDWREIMVEEGAEALFDAVAFLGLTQECLLSLAKKGRWFLACTHFGFDIPLNRVPHFNACLTQVMYSMVQLSKDVSVPTCT